MRKNFLVLIFVFFLLFLTACGSGGSSQKTVIIENAWARPALQGNPSAVYFVINNQQDISDRLTSVSSEIAEFNEIHLSSMVDGTMKMMEQDYVEIEANNTLEFKPKSYHVMLINLKQDLKVGDQFEVSLFFEKSGEKIINVEVKEFE